MLLHPLGTLTVKQSVVPLDIDISRFGQAAPAGARRFTISSVSLGGQSETTEPVKDFFAPAQFFEMSDDEKLSRPSFEPMAAGVGIGSDGVRLHGETPTIGSKSKRSNSKHLIMDKEKWRNRSQRATSEESVSIERGAVWQAGALRRRRRRATIRRTGKAKYRTSGGQAPDCQRRMEHRGNRRPDGAAGARHRSRQADDLFGSRAGAAKTETGGPGESRRLEDPAAVGVGRWLSLSYRHGRREGLCS